MKAFNEFLNEGKFIIPKPDMGRVYKEKDFQTGWDIIEYLDGFTSLRKYKNTAAEYDDSWYSIPRKVWDKVIGWSDKEMDNLNKNLEDYEGSLHYNDKEVSLIGGA
jgi:hypothetical protein